MLDESVERSEEDVSRGEAEVLKSHWTNEDRALKDKLLRKYSKYISSLKHEFSNKKKKGKLPKEARQVLLDWWNIHYRWPYPTVSIYINPLKSCINYAVSITFNSRYITWRFVKFLPCFTMWKLAGSNMRLLDGELEK